MNRTSGIRNIAMGFSGVADNSGLYAPYWNPAASGLVERNMVGFNLYKQFETINHASLDFMLFEKDRLTLGLNIIQEEIANIPLTDDVGGEGVKNGSFSDTNRLYNLNMATKIATGTYIGQNIKLLSHDIHKYNATGYALDFGIMQRIDPETTFGFSYRNIISAKEWSTGTKEHLEQLCTLGVNRVATLYDIDFSGNFDYSINPEDFKDSMWGLGTEVWLVPQLASGRLGLNSRKQFTLGLGITIKEFQTDFAYVIEREDALLGNSFFFASLFKLPNFDFNLRQPSNISQGTQATAKESEAVEADDDFSLFQEPTEQQSVASEPTKNSRAEEVTAILKYREIVVDLAGLDDVVTVALLSPAQEVSYYLPTNNQLLTIPLTEVTGNYTLFIQRYDSSVIRREVNVPAAQ